MQAKNSFSSSVSFNIFYLAEPNKSVTHTHTHSNNGLSLCTKAIAVRPARAPVRRFKHLQGAFKALCRCFFVCVGERMKQKIDCNKNQLDKRQF